MQKGRLLSKNSTLFSAVLLLTLLCLYGCPPAAYITNSFDDTVSVIDTATDEVVATIPVGEFPEGAVVLPDGSAAYVTNWGSGTVSVIDTDTNTVSDTIPLGYPDDVRAGVGITVTPDGSRVYVADNQSSDPKVSVIDTATNSVVDTVSGIELVKPFNIAMHPDGSKVYVAQVGILPDVDKGKVIDTGPPNTLLPGFFQGSGMSWAIAVHPDGSRLYVAEVSAVNVIDTVTNGLITSIPLQGWGELNERSIAISPDGSWVYATYQDPNTNPETAFGGRVAVINTATNAIEGVPIPVGNFPTGVDVLPDGSKVYVVNTNTYGGLGTVSVIDATTKTVIKTITVGNRPTAYGKFIG